MSRPPRRTWPLGLGLPHQACLHPRTLAHKTKQILGIGLLGVVINGHQSIYQIEAQAGNTRSVLQRGSKGLSLARTVKSPNVERATRLVRHFDLCSTTTVAIDRAVGRKASSDVINWP